MKNKLILGSRGSRLALWQTNFVAQSLKNFHPNLDIEIKVIKTSGDAILDTALSKIGDKGLFTRQIEEQLLSGEIAAAVHSLKDLPTNLPNGLKIGAVSARETPNDVLIGKNSDSIESLPPNAKVATGSLRRRSQLLNFRPDLQISEIRGNVPTRIEKFFNSDLDAMILAFAGVHRLGFDSFIKQVVPIEILLPAVAQGVVGIEIRTNDEETEEIFAPFNNLDSYDCILAERSFLNRLEGGCQVPIAGFAALDGEQITLSGFTGSFDGKVAIREIISGHRQDAIVLGRTLAGKMIAKGAADLLDSTRNVVEQTAEKVV